VNAGGRGTRRSNGRGEPAAVSWDRARARLATLERMMQEVESPSPARARALLEARAERLARPLGEEAPAGERLDVAVFALARERYAIETRLVREIVRFAEYTPVPGAADFLVGVTNLRGEILPVIDLRRFFALPDRGLTDQSRVLVLGHDRKDVGVLADEAQEVASLAVADVLEPTAAAPSIGREYIRGVTREALIVLDGDRLLRDPRLFIDHGEELRRSSRPD
jgi:purine-binding chemotaxis protein CheW